MVPPISDTAPNWTDLTPAQKRERVLAVAGRLFAQEGIGFPMPDLAEAIGVGVGTLYRQFGSKEDVIAALVVRRAGVLSERFDRACEEDDAFAALCRVTAESVREGLGDRVAQEAWSFAAGHADVEAARRQLGDAMERLVQRAHAQGALRPGITASDIGLIFTGARAAEGLREGGADRLLLHVLTGIAAPGHEPPAR